MIPGRYKRSGGPTSREGRGAVALNALKAGAYSKVVILPGEALADFESLQMELQRSFAAEGALELLLVGEIAKIVWKKLRLERLENSAVMRILSGPMRPQEILSHYDGPSNERALDLLADPSLFERDLVAEAARLREEVRVCEELISRKARPSEFAEGCPLIAKMVNAPLASPQEG